MAILIPNTGTVGGTIPTVTVAQAAAAQASAGVTTFAIKDSAANVFAGLGGLVGLGKLRSITFTDLGAPSWSLTGADYAADVAVLAKITSAYGLAVGGASVAQAAGLQANAHVTAVAITDTAAHVQGALASLLADSKIRSISLADSGTPSLTLTGAAYAADAAVLSKITSPYGLVVSGATVAHAGALQANSHVTSFTVTDTAANVMAGLGGLAGLGKISSIVFSGFGTPSLSITGAAYAADAAVLAKFASAYSLVVSGANVAQAAGLQANAHVSSLTITDTAANVQAGLSNLLADAKIRTISLSDAGTPSLSLTGAAYAADAAVLAKITSPYGLVVSGASVAQAAGLQANPHVSSFTVTDTAAGIQANLATLNADSRLASVAVANGQPVVMTVGQFQADAALIGKFGGAAIDVTGVSAAAATAVGQNVHVKAEGVTDTLANVGANLDALEALAKAGKLTGIAVSNVGQTLALSASRYAADSDAIKLMTGQFTINQSAAPTGLQINFVYDPSMAGAPAAYIAALNTAAGILKSEITNGITLNIEVGWGDVGGTPIAAGVAEGGTGGDIYQSYSVVRSELQAHVSGPASTAASLLGSTDPFGGASYDVSGALAKAWGLTGATSSVIDGMIGVASTGWSVSDYVGVLLHEITHAMGRNAGWGGLYGDTTPLDLFRYSAPGVVATDGSVVDPTLHPGASSLQYFSLDGGTTVLADYASVSDYGDWASNSLTTNDPNNAFMSSNSNAMTPVDLLQLGAEGFALSTSALATIAASGLRV